MRLTSLKLSYSLITLWNGGSKSKGTTCVGDFDYNNNVGTSDFMLFLAAFGLEWTGPYDMSGNEVIELIF